MPTEKEKIKLRQKLGTYEGTIEHMYLDTKGYVTIGTGHLLKDVAAAQKLNFVHQKNGKKATDAEIKADYESVKKQNKGMLAGMYKKHTKLKLKQVDIDALTDKHIEQFEKELKRLYGASEFKGYPSDVRLALFDMIFNLGMTNLKNKFPTFNKHVKAEDWSGAAKESKRTDVGEARNKYVRELFEKAAKDNEKSKTP